MVGSSRQFIWLSFDLGVRGDYDGLYAWLDEHGAKECGNGVAAIAYPHDGETLPSILKAELAGRVNFDKRSRVYLIYRDQKSRRNKGEFLFGGRRAAPWSGFGTVGGAPDEDEV